jgi:photosystem II stability/assembly factor-like uncharacterized protein
MTGSSTSGRQTCFFERPAIYRSLRHKAILLMALGFFWSGSARAQERLSPNRQGMVATTNGLQEQVTAARKRSDWFHEQRTFPQPRIPAGARSKAFEQKRASLDRQGAMHPEKLLGSQASPAASPYAGLAWKPIGPQPTQSASNTAGSVGPTSGRVTAIAVDPGDATGNTVFLAGAQGGVWKSIDGGKNWQPLTDNQLSLAMGSLAIAPSNDSIIYAGTGEEAGEGFDAYYGVGVLKSLDGGNTWALTCTGSGLAANTTCPFSGPFNDGFFPGGGARIGSLAVNPLNANQVLAGTQIFFSTKSQPGEPGVYCTNDGGATWQILPGAKGAMATAVFFASPTIAYAALGYYLGDSSNGIYVSANANLPCSQQTWTHVTASGLPSQGNLGRIELTSAASNAAAPGYLLYAAIADANSGSNNLLGVYRSADGGNTWTTTAAPDFCTPQCWYDLVLRADPGDPSGATVFAGGSATSNGTLLRTADGGNTWSRIDQSSDASSLHPDHHAIAFAATAANQELVYVGNDGGVWSAAFSTVSGSFPASPAWNDLNSTLALTQFYPGLSIHPSTPSPAFGGTQGDDLQMYSGTAAWTALGLCTDGGYTAVDPFVPSNVYVSCAMTTAPFVAKSVAGGQPGSYAEADSGISNSDPLYPVPPLVPDPSTQNRLYFGTNRLYQSSDGANTWAPISGNLANSVGNGFALTTIAVDASNAAIVYTGAQDGSVQVSKDVAAGQSATFTNISNGLPGRVVTKIVVDPSDSTGNPAYAAFSGFAVDASAGGAALDLQGHIFTTTTGGTSWSDVSCHVSDCSIPGANDLPNTPVDDLVLDPDDATHNTLYAATDIGMFVTTDGGATWSVLGTGLPNVAVLSLVLHEPSRTLRAATHGRSVWDLALPGLTNTGSFALSSLNPTSAQAGSGNFTLTVTGRGFTSNSQINWNGSSAGITNLDASGAPTVLTGTISNSLLVPGTAQVTVTDPGQPNPSNALAFSILAPSNLSVATIVPASVSVDATDTAITVTGTGFAPKATVTFEGSTSGVTTTLVNAAGTQITATLSHTLLQFGGAFLIGVTNPPPGGGASPQTAVFTVNNTTPPINDNFANAITISTAIFSSTVDNFAATTETTDPQPSCASGSGNPRGKTVWWKYTAGASNAVTATTAGSAYDTLLDVVTGLPGAFVEVACNHNVAGSHQSAAGFTAVTGTTYYFMVSVFDVTQTGSPDLESGGKTVFNFAGPPAAGLGASPTFAAVNAGGTATFTIATFSPPFTAQVALSVSGCPTNSTCTLGATTVTASSGTTLTVVTSAASRALPTLDDWRHIVRKRAPSWMFTIMLLIVTFSIGQMARRRRVPALRLGAFLLLIAFASAGCGLGDSGGSIPATTDTGTPSGIYPMVVTGTAGTITSTTTVTVNVN